VKISAVNYFLLFLFVFQTWVKPSPAQSFSLNRKLDLNYSKYGGNGAMYNIFSLLASNNSVNIYSLNVNLTFSVWYEFSGQKDFYKIKYRFYGKKADGDIKFRDFVIDTLLVPDSVLVLIKLKTGLGYETYSQKLAFNAGTVLLQKTANVRNLPSPYFTVTKAVFSHENLERFLRTANLINNYYGYSLLYSKMLKYFDKMNLKPDNPPSEVFAALLAFNRLNNYAAKHDFEGNLHLNRLDTENLLKKQEKAGRMLLREKTLMKQKLTVPPSQNDCRKFVDEYIALSETAIVEARKLQPFQAGSFKEFASEFQNENTLGILKSVEKYYSPLSDCGSVMRMVFDGFVKKAVEMSEQKNYVFGLIMLDNASYLYKNFDNVKRNAGFINAYAKLYDGLLSSYASVAVSALKAGNGKMFKEYYGKADKLFKKHLNDTSFSRLKIRFPRYRDRLIELSRLGNGSVEFINNALLANAGIRDSTIENLFAGYCRRKLNSDIYAINTLLKNRELVSARKYVDNTAEFVRKYRHLKDFGSIGDSTLNAIAYSVYIELLQQGEMDYDKGKVTEAMDYLSQAYEMENLYFDFHSPELHRVLKKSFTPVALEYLRNASLQIWANRLDEAEKTIDEVKELQKRYKQTDNKKINGEILKLQNRINRRICMSVRQEIDNLCANIALRVKRGEIDRAQKSYDKLISMQNRGNVCDANDENIRKTIASYGQLFDFNARFKMLKRKIFKDGFSKSIDDYVALERRFKSGNLSRFNTGFAPLYQFVEKQNSRTITTQTLEYFLKNNDYQEAYRYLELLRKMNVDPVITRVYQRKLAKLYRQNHDKPADEVFSNPWYATFKNYYLGLIKEKLNPVKLIKN
jgi:hypothetical protein